MVSKDQAIGWVIFLVCAIVALAYTVSMLWPSEVADLLCLDLSGQSFRLYLVAVPVLLAFVAVLAIGAWIGWTMGTTPPPRPIEDIESESA
ncbi:MAG: transcriptional regulator [Candidatus Bathyarchaeum sp.]|nr:MAG: transcriptional regulator [Candidatus Bathyarchaeum sp.]